MPQLPSIGRMPAEWHTHEACLVAWPHAADYWQDDLVSAQAEFVALCHAIAEPLHVLVPAAHLEAARAALAGCDATFHEIPTGDIWVRDTGPIYVHTPSGGRSGQVFRFNGWGGSYLLEHDPDVAARVLRSLEHAGQYFPFVLEGGAVEVDDVGTCLTSKQCLLNKNRNPGWTSSKVFGALSSSLGVRKLIWVDQGLANDHTDGHIDTIVRFVGPAHVVCMHPQESDPNREVLLDIRASLEGQVDAVGRPIKVSTIGSPGAVYDDDGALMPASYVNFYIANHRVVVPQYGSRYDHEALEGLAALFPDREVVGVSARAILTGGGAFHCITQQIPKC